MCLFRNCIDTDIYTKAMEILFFVSRTLRNPSEIKLKIFFCVISDVAARGVTIIIGYKLLESRCE